MNNLNSVSWHFIKIDSFQDPSSDYSKRQKLTPFKTLVFYIEIDSFQDPVSDVYGETSEIDFSRLIAFYIGIDSFQDVQFTQNITNWLLSRPFVLHPIWILSRPAVFWTQIDSFQDPVQWTIWNIPIDSFQDPHIGLLQCFNLHGRLPAKSPWETSFIHNSLKHPTQWNLDFFHETKEEDTSHASNQHISTPRHNTFYIRHRNIHQNQFLSRPQKLHINRSQQYPSKDTISLTLTQDKDTITIHITNLYILISDFKLLKSTLHPLRTHVLGSLRAIGPIRTNFITWFGTNINLNVKPTVILVILKVFCMFFLKSFMYFG